MEEHVLRYDGTWKGVLSLIFDVYAYKYNVSTIEIEDEASQPLLFTSAVMYVTTDDVKSARVTKGIIASVGQKGYLELYHVFLSEKWGRELLILRTTQYYLRTKVPASRNYAHGDVLEVKKIVKSVSRERHRMKAFVRFQLLDDGIYFAIVEPDFNVLPLVSKHFKDRYADQKWIIYDVKRKYGIYYDGDLVQEVEFGSGRRIDQKSITLAGHESELLYSKLWNQYFNSVNIKERKNLKLHIQHVPKRYWKYLNEK
ncbi:DNA metabolism protein [Sphingobacterium alkalisoli]|uniref:DNA metabolism protein n=1 Tax=Sphingobacterium alkalisoli TaxID=1874115 RepID=A0A4U0GX74_9SPHI|nr:TIGR03915 family putative DNA repair protein [Sphingobacterium alkalisoli]TJY63755.1 DNA metabolism protein [Sphingobacterium alkalisoli]GGH25090.1 DNA metabolism protein [Sphingobacterium alkalisoli]